MTDSLPTLTLHQKYAQAVTLYTSTERSLKDIAGECGVSATALGAYLRRYRRELVLRRNGMEEDGCIKAAGRQTAPAHAKYKEAVAACDMMEYIDLNVSQVARKFRVDGTALANFMRTHYPDIPVRREALRRKLGINDDNSYVARIEAFIDGEKVEDIEMPYDYIKRKYDIFYTYELPVDGPHTLRLKWVNPDPGYVIEAKEMVVYSAKK